MMSIRSILDSTRRITTSGTWVAEVDGIRFLAIALVLVNHVHERVIRRTKALYPDIIGGPWDALLSQGDVGVLIFFALSGYILGKSIIPPMDRGESVSIARYYCRRLTRLEPPYLISMVAIYALLAITGFQSQNAKSFNEGASSLTSALGASSVYSYVLIYGTLPKLNPPAWSLEVEVQFYLLVPAFAWLLTRMKLGWRIVVLTASLLLWAVFLTPLGAQNAHLRKSLLVYLPYFGVGLLVVDLERISRFTAMIQVSAWRGVMDLVALGSLSLLLLGGTPLKGFDSVAVRAVLAGLFLVASLNSAVVKRVLQVPVVAVIGGMCYSIYLVHLPILEALSGTSVRLGKGLGLPYGVFLAVQFLLLVLPVLVVGWVFFRTIERPCMDRAWPQKLLGWVRQSFRSGPSA